MGKRKALEIYVKRKQELQRLIQQTEAYKKQVRTIVRDIGDQYKRGSIIKGIYREKIKHAFGDTTPLSLLTQYDKNIHQYKHLLQEQEKAIGKLSRSSPIPLALFIVFLLVASAVSLHPLLTGFFGIGKSSAYTKNVQLLAEEDTIYVLEIPVPGALTSLAVSGTVAGDGAVQLYLEDESTLIYDSTQKAPQKGFLSQLTGLLVAALNRTLGGSQPFVIVDENNQLVPINLEENNKQFTITPAVSFVDKLELTDVEGSLLGLSSMARGIVEPENVTFVKIYSLDATNLSFGKAEIYATAEGGVLYTCSFWDFSLSICLGDWDRLKLLEEGEVYAVKFDAGTVAFAEALEGENVSVPNKTVSIPPQPPLFPLTLLDVAAAHFSLGEVAKFNILVENELPASVVEVRAYIMLFDAEDTLFENFSTSPTTIDASAIKNLEAYWDTTSLQPGVYVGLLSLESGNATKAYTISMNITTETATTEILGITGRAVSATPPQEAAKQKTFASACVDTCSLPRLQQSAYTILIVVKDAVLNLSSIEYQLQGNETISAVNLTNLTPPANITTNVTRIKKENITLLLDKTKITYRDEKVKPHKLQRYARPDASLEKGKNWERRCQGARCQHELFSYNKYYEKEDSTFDLVENALTDRDCESSEALCIKSKGHKIQFKQLASASHTMAFTVANATLHLTPLQLRYATNTTQVIISSANPIMGEGIDNQFQYNNIFGRGIDMRLTYQASKIKEEIVIADDSMLQLYNLTNATGFVYVDYLVTKPSYLDWYVSNDQLVNLHQYEQLILPTTLHLRDARQHTLFTLPRPIASNANQSIFLAYVLASDNNASVLSMQIPLSYLQTASYPITIDPTILLTDTETLEDSQVKYFPNPNTYQRLTTGATLQLGDDSTQLTPTCKSTPADVCHTRVGFDWDISSIPNNAHIEDINFTIRVTTLGSPDRTFFFHHMDGNSTTYTGDNGDEHFWNDMGNGTLYAIDTPGGDPDFFQINLSQNRTIINDLHTILQNKQDYWSYGIKSNETNNTSATVNAFASENHETAGFRPRLLFTYDLPPPTVQLNAPDDGAQFRDALNVTLNATVEDNELLIPEVVFYGDNQSTPRAEAIIAIFTNVSNGTEVNYNWTAPVLLSDGNTVLHLHFDNRSEFGENDTEIVDFSNASNNGTLVGTAALLANVSFNASAGQLGGAFDFNASAAGQNRNITFGDQDELIGLDYTYLLWVRPTNTSVNGSILTKYSTSGITALTGFAIELVDTGQLLVRADTDVITVDGFFEEGTYTHLGITISASNDLVIYKDGVLNTSQTITLITDNPIPFDLAVETNFITDSFQGSIDELLIANRTYSEWEVLDAFRLKGDTYYWYGNATDLSGKNETGTTMSEIRNFTINLAPEITLNAPANESIFTSVGNIILNTTIIERDLLDSVIVKIFGSNKTTPTIEDLLYQQLSVANGTVVTYNWTSPVSNAGDTTGLVLHFDNRSEFGENDSLFYDFSSFGLNGTCTGTQCPLINMSGGKFAGGVVFDGIDDVLNISNDLQWHSPPFSVSFWMYPFINASEVGDMYLITQPDNNVFSLEWAFFYDNGADLMHWVVVGNDCLDLIFHAATTSTVRDRWWHVVGVLNESNSSALYINGAAEGTVDDIVSLCPEDGSDLLIGALRAQGTAGFNGTIDDVVFYNRTLTATDVTELYELQRGTYYWNVNATDNFTLKNSALSDTFQFEITNQPNVTSIIIEPDPANTTDTLNCTFTIEDLDPDDPLGANVTFYNGSVVFETFNISVTNGTQTIQAMTAQAQVKNEQWHCGVTPTDGFLDGDQRNSTTITIQNSLPTVPVLLEPPDDNVTTNRTPTFKWEASTDADGDEINYTLNLTCFSTSGGSCTAPGDDRLINLTEANHTLAAELGFFIDDGFFYNWTVLSYDGDNESAYSRTQGINLTVVVAIAITQPNGKNVNFQGLGLGETNDTSTSAFGGPDPFVVENQGNSLIEMNITELGPSLFVSSPAPSSAYQFKAAAVGVPAEGAIPSFNSSRSITSYTNVPVTNLTAIGSFNHSDPNDDAEIDINITVPQDEPPGTKGSSLVLTGYYFGEVP